MVTLILMLMMCVLLFFHDLGGNILLPMDGPANIFSK